MTVLTVSHRPADPAPLTETTVGGILRTAAEDDPDAPALVAGESDPQLRRRWTYGQLLAGAEAAAGALARRFEPGERLAVWAPTSCESLVLTYAAGLAGLVLVPLHPALRPTELAGLLDRSGAAGLFLVPHHRDQDLLAAVGSVRQGLPGLREVLSFDDWADLCTEGGPIPGPGPAPDDVAQLIFTSGTTGAPKAARLSHRAMTNAARFGGERFGIRPGDVYLDTMPLFHVGGQVVAFQICQARATAVLPPVFDPGLVLDLAESERATVTVGVPTMLLALIEHPDFTTRDLSRLRSVSSGGAVVPTELIEHLESTLGVDMTVCFGQTETSGFIAQTDPGDAAEDKAATVGRPLPGVEVRVVDEAGAVVALGVVGELHVRGPNVMAGYHGPPSPTGSDTTLDPEGWLRTGDLVTMDERGYLRVRGRARDVVISGGENLYPAEIESALAAHPDVSAAAVVGIPDPRWGETAVAFLRPAPGADLDPAAVESWLRDRLAPFKIPRRWTVVDDFPLTPSGKIQKYLLRDRIVDA